MMEVWVQMFEVVEEALVLRMVEERVLEMLEPMVFGFQGVEVVSCQLAVVDLSLKQTTQVVLH
jgi:hypothetical protein